MLGIEEPELVKIGLRHGEKMYETLLSREEMTKATDQGDYYKVPLDARSLQYSVYVDEGDTAAEKTKDFDSNNTEQMTVNQVASLISSLPEMQRVLAEVNR